MSAISLKSITGITSITTPAGVDNQLTLHTNDTTQRVKVTESGIEVVGVATFQDIDVDGHTNLDNVSISGMSTITGANIGNAQFTGSYVNVDGNLDIADSIRHLGDSNTKIRFPAADTFSVETAGSEALRITHQGRIGLNGVVPTSSHANVTSSIHLADSNTILSRTGNQYFALYQNLKQTSADITRYLVNGYASAYAQHTGTHRFYTVGNGTGNTNATVTERLRITNDGKVLIGGNSSSASSHADELQIINTSAQGGLSIINASNGQGNIYFGHSGGTADGRIEYSHQADYMRFFTANNERLRIDSNGRVLFSRGGLTSSRNVGTKTGEIQVANSGNSSAITMIGYANDASGPHLMFGKSRSGNATGSTIVQNGDRLGEIAFCGADGTDIDSFGAAIKAHVDGTPGANDMPGRLEFYTTPDGASGAVERLRITSSGNVLTSGNTQLFGSNTSDGSDNKAIMINGGGAVSDTRGGYLLVHGNEHSSNPGITRLHAGNVGTAYIAFNTAGSERLRIDSDGQVQIGSGTIHGGGHLTIRGGGVNTYATLDYQYVGTPSNNSTTIAQLRFTANTTGASVVQGAKIQAVSDAAWSATGDAPTRLEFHTVPDGSASMEERLRITSDGKVGINHSSPNTQLIVRAPGGSGHASAQVHSGDSSTIMNMQTVQGTEGRFGMNTNHNLAIYTNGLEKLHLSKTGSLFLKCLDTVPVNQAESGHYNSTGYNAGHTLGLMVKRSICVSDADTKGVGGIFLSHTRNVTCDGTTYNMMTLHNREGTFVGDVYVGFSVGGAGVVRHYKFTCLYSASTLTSIDNASRGGKSETISVNIVSSNDAHFFQVIPNTSTNETARVSMTIVGAACGRNDGAGGDYYTVNYN